LKFSKLIKGFPDLILKIDMENPQKNGNFAPVFKE